MSFIAWPSWCSLEAQWGAEREPRNPKRTEADHQGGLCLAGSPFSRVLIIAPFLPSMRNCTIVLVLHRQIGRTMRHPTRRKKPCPSPYPFGSRRNLFRCFLLHSVNQNDEHHYCENAGN